MNLDQQFYYQMSYLKGRRDMSRRPPQPPRFPATHTGETELSDDLCDLGMPLAVALGDQAAPQRFTHSLSAVSTVAHRAAAISKYEPGDLYPIHRPSPAPRCLYTSNLYLLSGGEPLPRDLYLYHPVRHTLFALRCDPERLPAEARNAWLITLDTRRLAFKYADFAERLGRLEAGHLVAQLQACLTALGWSSRLELLSPQRLAYLPEHEQAVALLHYDPDCSPFTPHSHPSGPAALKTPFEECVRRRESGFGPNGVRPLPLKAPLEQLLQMARVGLESEGPGSAELGFGLRAVVLNVEHLPVGIYEFAHATPPRLLNAELKLDALFKDLFLGSGFSTQHCSVVWFITANVPLAFAKHGEQAYNALMLGAGRIAQRMELCAAAYGQFARPCMNYDEAGMDYHLGCAAGEAAVLCQLLVGCNRANSLSLKLDL